MELYTTPIVVFHVSFKAYQILKNRKLLSNPAITAFCFDINYIFAIIFPRR